MTDEDVFEFNSAGRMSQFGAANNTIIKTSAKAVSSLAALDADVAALEASGAMSVSAGGTQRDGTQDKTAAQTALDKLVRKIAKTAKVIKTEEPDFDNKFKLERGSLNNQELLDTARAFQGDVLPVEAKFADYGVTSAATKLQTGINSFEAGQTQQNTGKGGGVAATAQTRANVKSLKKNRRTLKTIVANLLEEAGEVALLEEWKSACRVEKAAKKDKGTTPPAP